MTHTSHQDFVPSLIAELPELREELEHVDGQLHSQMGAFALYTQACKTRGDLGTYEHCLQVADRLFANADAELAAAFRGSFLEHLEFEGSRGPAAWRLVPPRLQAVWNQLAAENRRLMSLPQKGSHEKPRMDQGQGQGQGQGRGPKRRQRRGRRR